MATVTRPFTRDPELAADAVLVSLAIDGPAAATALLDDALLHHPTSRSLMALREAAAGSLPLAES
jgi:hypothetical protein